MRIKLLKQTEDHLNFAKSRNGNIRPNCSYVLQENFLLSPYNWKRKMSLSTVVCSQAKYKEEHVTT